MHCVGLLFEEIRENLHMSILVLVDAKDFPPTNKSIFFVKVAIFCKKI